MKYYFIINPAAGKSNPYDRYGDAIRAACESKGLQYEFLFTEGNKHATALAERIAGEATEENPVRVFSVGGDGTLCETATGLIGKPHCELGCLPCGSGNDYIRTYASSEDFLDFASYIVSPSVSVDCIKAGELCSINLCSMGLDAMICETANRLKEKHKRLSGPAAYNKAVFRCITGKLYNDLRVTFDDSEVFEGKYIFALAASGQYYGGGFHSAPMSDPSDGLLDFVLLKTVPHFRVPVLLGPYKKGTYLTNRGFKKLVTHRRMHKMTVESRKPAVVTIDGECIKVNKITFEVMPSALRFIVPESSHVLAKTKVPAQTPTAEHQPA